MSGLRRQLKTLFALVMVAALCCVTQLPVSVTAKEPSQPESKEKKLTPKPDPLFGAQADDEDVADDSSADSDKDAKKGKTPNKKKKKEVAKKKKGSQPQPGGQSQTNRNRNDADPFKGWAPGMPNNGGNQGRQPGKQAADPAKNETKDNTEEPKKETDPANPAQKVDQNPGAGDAPAPPDPQIVKKVMDIQNRHTRELMSQKGVVGTATGIDDDGNVVVQVMTTGADNPIIPAKLEGVKVVEMQTGPIHKLQLPLFPLPADPNTFRQRLPRPVPIGISSIADELPDICAAGTLGCRLKDEAGNIYALSNNHVFAGENLLVPGWPAVQPGPLDLFCFSDDSTDTIGLLFDFIPIDFTGLPNIVDTAICITTTDFVNNSTLRDGYGIPQSTTVLPILGQSVQKYGRTTGYTKGIVISINFALVVTYETGDALFIDQIAVLGDGFPSLGAPGDSGSLVVDNQRRPVGLLFAGGGGLTACNKIRNVINSFGIPGLHVDDSPPSPTSPNTTPIGKVGHANPNPVAPVFPPPFPPLP